MFVLKSFLKGCRVSFDATMCRRVSVGFKHLLKRI